MSILSRFKDIIAADINALLDKAEDPAKMIDHYLIKAKEDLRKRIFRSISSVWKA